MRSYSVVINNSMLCEEVFRITANAAKERGDALHAATEEDKALIEGFIAGAMPVLRTAFGRFIDGAANVGIGYSMPENWKVDVVTVSYCCNEFLTNYALARWYELSGVANGCMNAANAALEALRLCLGKRVKPIR